MKLLACVVFLTVSLISVNGQSATDKITPQEYIEANEFAHRLSHRVVKATDLGPLIRAYAIENFNDCISETGYGTLRDDTLMANQGSLHPRFYLAEINFFHLISLFRLTLTDEQIDKLDESDDPFAGLPVRVRNIISSLDEPSVDEDRPLSISDKEKNFKKFLLALEKSNPLLRKYVTNGLAAKPALVRKNILRIEKNSEYAFRPELLRKPPKCFEHESDRRFISVDILPWFNMTLTKVDDRLKLVSFIFHVDD
ncbi:MAG: hypothetical protein WBO10_06240 [Pyrinomonadaceae bacterium]